MGWYYSAALGPVDVRGVTGEYTVSISNRWIARARNPKQALRRAIMAVRAEHNEIGVILKMLEWAAPERRA